MPARVYVITGRPVSGKNSMQFAVNRRTGHRFVKTSKAARAWQIDAIEQLVAQRGRSKTLLVPVYVEYVAYQASDICDIDNMEAALFDALKKARIIDDDALIVDHRGRKAVDRARPRFEVIVRPAVEVAA